MLTDQQIIEARQMRDKNTPWKVLAAHFQTSPYWVRIGLEPDWRVKRRNYDNALRKTHGRIGVKAAGIKQEGIPRETWMARLAEIPPDDRGLTARLMGDPLPQRSALWARQS